MFIMQKQVIYAKFIPRVFAVTFDLFIISLTLSKIVNVLYNILFYFTFHEQLANIESAGLLNASYEAAASREFLTFFANSPEAMNKMMALYVATFIPMLVLMGVYFVCCWFKFGTTVGAILMGIKIVDERSLKYASIRQLIKRYIGYSLSFIGVWWILFDKKNRALHDKLAGTVVVKR